MESKTTRFLNLTPLTFREVATQTYLQPLKPAVELPSGKIQLLDDFCGFLYTVDPKEQDVILDLDFLWRSQWSLIPPRAFPYRVLAVQNNSGSFVNTYRFAAPNYKAEQMQSIPPGKTYWWEVRVPDLWSFRATFTDELVGLVRIGFRGPGTGGWGGLTWEEAHFRVTLTDDFVKGRRAYLNKASNDAPATTLANDKLAPSFTPRRIIGEKRSSTPPADAHEFLTATDIRREFSKEAFNARKNRVLRDVEIAGVLMRWGGSNRVLSNYYGEDKDDIRSLTIYADRMEVSDHLRFPGTNVTIYARELAFTSEIASIDTTPLENPVRASSEFFTKDPEDLTNADFPADKKGSPTYTARDGEKGERGGTITLYAEELFDETGDAKTKRFICRGGKGQAAEGGGLKKYQPQPGYPEKYGVSQTVTAADVAKLLKEKLAGGIRYSNIYWPGGGNSPDKLTYDSPEVNPLNTGHAVAVTLIPDLGTTEHGHLPNPQWLPPDKPNPHPKPCNGRDAYPGGWPGDGGDGGNLNLHLGSGSVPEAHCDVGPGEPANPASVMEGAKPPGPCPAYALEIRVVTSERIRQNQPHLNQTTVTGNCGKSSKSRRIVSGAPTAVNDTEEVKQSTAKPGKIEQKPAGDQWAHPNLVCAVLRYARTSYRNGFREDAAAALDPYYALIGLNGSPRPTMGPDGKPKPIDGRLRMALLSVMSMRDNLNNNLDYYGKPPGWVPRLNALSNLQLLNTVRETAYETFYFADKLLRDYDTLDDAREVSQKMSDALKAELSFAKSSLQEAYEKIPESLRDLMDAQTELEPIKEDIEDLKKWGELVAEKLGDTIKIQRVYSAAMQILGGIAKSLPVGQPFVGLAGSAFEAASQVDWNAQDPLKTARSAIDSFSGEVTDLMKNKKKHVAALLTKDLRKSGSKQDDTVTKLTRLLDDETKIPEAKAKAIESSWKHFRVEERNKLAGQIADEKMRLEAINEYLKTLNNRIETLRKDAAKKAELEASEEDKRKQAEERNRIQEQIVQLQENADLLEQERLEKLEDLGVYRERLAVAQEEARDEADEKRVADGINSVDNLIDRVNDAKRTSEDQAKRIAKREETVTEVMTNLESLGSGLSLIGNGIVSLATPLTPADPTWKRLAAQMVQDDPELQQKSKQLERKMREALERKKHKVEELLRWQQVASSSIATIGSTLGALTELSQQRRSIDQGLNPAVKVYLEDTKERARDTLSESIYWFVKSYQYEFLSDVDDTFYNFDAWTEKLREMERTKKAKMAADHANSGVSAGEAGAVVLDYNEFREVGDGVFKAEALRLAANLLRIRQTRGEKRKGVYKSCVIERLRSEELNEKMIAMGLVTREISSSDKQVWMKEMLDRLLKEGQASFNFVRDFEKGSFRLNDARVVDVQLTSFEITTDDPNLSLTIRVAHSGQSVIAKRAADGGQEFFAFQSGKGDEPIFWQFVYNHSEPPERRLSQMLSADIVIENVKMLFNDQLASFKFQDYSPGLFSDYIIEITDLKEKQSRVQSINKLVMDVTITQAG